MKILGLRLLLATGAWFTLGGAALAATTVNFGTFGVVTGPGSLDLTGTFPYAVNFNGANKTVGGVTFVSDTTPQPGATYVGPNMVTAWQAKPEFGATADATALEDIFHDIRWANGGAVPAQMLGADLNVTTGGLYKLQILFYGNWEEDRRWDIMVDGVQLVDQVSSLGVSTGGTAVAPAVPAGTAYAANQGLVFTYNFTAPDSQVNVSMGQLFGVVEGRDINPIWQGLTLERIPEPSVLGLGAIGMLAWFRRRSR